MPVADNPPPLTTRSFRIGGMTCPACQHRIETALKNTAGIRSASADYVTGAAQVQYDATVIGFDAIAAAINNLGYETAEASAKKSFSKTALHIAGVLVIILACAELLQALGTSGFAAAFPLAQSGMGNSMVLLIGLLTSVHCIAMCGGINLSQTLRNDGVAGRALLPALLYNGGRLISYTAVGVAVGAIGSAITVSGWVQGAVFLLAGTFMVIMGINMLGIFPALKHITPHWPQFHSTGKGPLIIGFLNGFMPCGPLQAMQLYALSTGSPVRGGVSMFLFCLGTIPLVFALGATGSLLSGARGRVFSRRVMKTGAVIIAAMGVAMFSNGWNSSGLPVRGLPGSGGAFAKAGGNFIGGSAPSIQNGKQVVNSILQPGRYPAITVQQGIPVRWTISAPQGSINGCNNRFVIREYGITHTFKPGDNIIEFIPAKSGQFRYSCWMSMIHGTITVLAPGETFIEPDITPKPSGIKIPTDSVAIASAVATGGSANPQTADYHIVTIDLNDNGFSPAIVVMQRGTPTEWMINNNSRDPDNYRIIVPAYYARMEIQQGENILRLVPDGDFEFSAGNHTFYGYVKVVNDINHIDIETIKAEVKNRETFIYPEAYFET